MTLRHYLPLACFVLPTVVIGYGFVIPSSCIAGVNELTRHESEAGSGDRSREDGRGRTAFRPRD